MLLILFLLLMSTPLYAAGGAEAESVLARADVVVTSTATVVANAFGDRVFLSCTNTHATVHVRWGDATVTATKGQQIRAGKAVQINNRDAVYMISEGADVTVACTEERR